MKSLFRMVLVFGCLAAMPAGVHAQNLCPNPGMEEGAGNTLTGWMLKGANGKCDETRAHSGKRSLTVSRSEPKEDTRWISAPIPATPGTYRLSGWLRGHLVRSPDYSYGVKLYVIERAADGRELKTLEGLTSESIPVQKNAVGYALLRFDWTYCEKTIVIGKETASIILSFGINGTFGPTTGEGAWLDDVRLEPVAQAAVSDKTSVIRHDIGVRRMFKGKETEFRAAAPLHGVFRPDEPVELVVRPPEKREDARLHWIVRDGWNVALAEGTQVMTDDGMRIVIGPETARPFRWLAVEINLGDRSGLWAQRVVNIAVIPDLSAKTAHPFQGMGGATQLFPLTSYLGITEQRSDSSKPFPGLDLFTTVHDPIKYTPEQIREKVDAMAKHGGDLYAFWQLGNEVPMWTKDARDTYRPRWAAFVDELKKVAPDVKPVFGSLNVWSGVIDAFNEGFFDDASGVDLHYSSEEQVASLRSLLDKKYGVGKKRIFMTEIGVFGSQYGDAEIIGEMFRAYAANWCAGADAMMWCNIGGWGVNNIEQELKTEMGRETSTFVRNYSWTPAAKLVAHAIMVDTFNGMKPVESRKLWTTGHAWIFSDGDRRGMVLQGDQQTESSSLTIQFPEPTTVKVIDIYGCETTLAPASRHVLKLNKIPVVVSWRGPVAGLETAGKEACDFNSELIQAPTGGRTKVVLAGQTAGTVRLRSPENWSVEPATCRIEPGKDAQFTIGVPKDETVPGIRLYAEQLEKDGSVTGMTWTNVKRVHELEMALNAVPSTAKSGPAVRAQIHNYGEDSFEGKLRVQCEATRGERPIEADFTVTIPGGGTIEKVLPLAADDIDLNREWGYRTMAQLFAKDGRSLGETKADLLFRGIPHLADDWKIDGDLSKYAGHNPIRVEAQENFYSTVAWASKTPIKDLWKGVEDFSTDIHLGYNEHGLIAAFDIHNRKPFMIDPDAAGALLWKNDSYEFAIARNDPETGAMLGMVKVIVAFTVKGMEVVRYRIDSLHGYDSVIITGQVKSAGKAAGDKTVIELLMPWDVLGNPPHRAGDVLPFAFCGNKYYGDAPIFSKRERIIMGWGGMCWELTLGGGEFARMTLE
ncbi:MAG: hypothetical protein WAX69_02060 [Victivallales bacterium]